MFRFSILLTASLCFALVTPVSAQVSEVNSSSDSGSGGSNSSSNSEGSDSGSSGSSDSGSSGEASSEKPYSEQYRKVDAINPELGDAPEDLNRSTPQATLENFVRSTRDGNFERAAHSLNWERLPKESREGSVADVSRQLHEVFEKKLWIDWESLPDRTDGQFDVGGGVPDGLLGKPRRNIRVGLIDLDGVGVPIRVERIKAEGEDPIWLLSANTVENIPRLYEAHGPSQFAQMMPSWSRAQFWRLDIWKWIGLLLGIILAAAFAYAVGRLVAHWDGSYDAAWTDSLTDRTRIPITLLTFVLTLYVIEHGILRLTGPVAFVLDPLLLVVMVAGFAWLVSGVADFFMTYLVRDRIKGMEDQDDEDTKRLLTQLSVGRRVLTLIIVLAGIGVLMLQLEMLEVLGSTLLASAGVLGLIFGFAARTVLGNVIAGLQVAITRPVRIGDSVLYEGNWGKIEDIGFTYLTIHTWDKRRVIVPLQYFVSNPFENWSKTDTELIKPIYIYVDYTTDIEAVRDEFARLCRNHELYDGVSDPTVQVTALKEEVMEVRALCSAETDSDAWELHCDLREALIKFVREQKAGRYLPRERVLLQNGNGNGSETDQESVATSERD